MAKRLKVIVNPISGSGKAVRFLKRLEQELARNNIAFDTFLTTQPGDAHREATTCRDKGYTALLCLSGDGTINEVVNGIVSGKPAGSPANRGGQNIPLGVIPFGSGNVIAKGLGIRRDIRQFLDLYRQDRIITLDAGKVTNQAFPGRYFISMVGVGYDAEVAHRYHISRAGKSKLQAHLFSYFPIAVKTLLSYQMPRIAVNVDGRVVTEDAGFIQIANTHSYGGPFVFVPNAVMDDGLLDVLWFGGRSRLYLIPYYMMALLGNGSLSPDAQMTRGRIIEITSLDKTSVQVDGDYCGELPARVEIIPEAIQVFADKSL